ncbi:MAG: hypothetical protein WDW36_006315 [Sanguina aurantia]
MSRYKRASTVEACSTQKSGKSDPTRGLSSNLVPALGAQAKSVPRPTPDDASARAVVIWIGPNDILGSLLNPSRSDIPNIIPCITAAVTTLLDNGESNIIVGTLAPAYISPLATTFGAAELLQHIILPLNQALQSAVSKLAAAHPLCKDLRLGRECDHSEAV